MCYLFVGIYSKFNVTHLTLNHQYIQVMLTIKQRPNNGNITSNMYLLLHDNILVDDLFTQRTVVDIKDVDVSSLCTQQQGLGVGSEGAA